MQPEAHNLHRIWRETDTRLDSLARRVAENRDVQPALEFARWLFWSGILELLEANACDGFLKVDGAHLRWRCEELQRQCTERYRLNDTKPHVEALQLQSIHEKLNLMAGYLSRLTVGPVQPAVTAPLQIISGGLDVDPSARDSSTASLKAS